jgi:hypothetical protein
MNISRRAVTDLADEGDIIVEQALDAADGGLLVDEVGEAHLDMAHLRLQPLGHLREHLLEGLDADLLLVLVEDLHEAGHVRALEVVGQIDVHVEGGDRVLFAIAAIPYPDRMTDVLDANLVDGDLAGVGAGLDIGDGQGAG